MKDPLVVQGFVDDGEVDNYCDAPEEYPDEGPLTVPIHLTAARFQPTGYLAAPLGSADDWLGFPYAVVAVIPRDDDTKKYVVKHNKFKSLVPAEIVIGPYVINAKVWSTGKYGLETVAENAGFVIQDATLECRLPGAKFPGLEASLMVVRTHLLQSISTMNAAVV
jgi:hypothetical protein